MKKCAVCSREARGFGWSDPIYRFNDPRRNKTAKAFCSMRCMNIFTKHLKTTGGYMIDPTNTEKRAMQSALKPLGEYVAEVGMNKPLAMYSRSEIETLVEVVVTAYQEFMQCEEEHTKDQEVPF